MRSSDDGGFCCLRPLRVGDCFSNGNTTNRGRAAVVAGAWGRKASGARAAAVFFLAPARRRIKIAGMPHRDPWTTAEEALLGTAPDPVIAKRLGRTRIAITQRREVLGIAAFRLGSITRRRLNGARTELALLGRYPDKHVAKLTGRSLAQVKAKRLEIGNGRSVIDR